MAVAKGLLETDLLHLPVSSKIHLLQNGSLFLIPALGLRKPVKTTSVPIETTIRTYAATPHQMSANSSLKRTQVQRFQGFDINDFADLRESHDMFIADVVNVQADDRYLDPETGAFDMQKADLLAYSHGKYYGLGEFVGKFGWSVKKKK